MNSKTIGKIGVGSWTFPWATGTVLDHRPEHVLDPPGVVQRAKDLGVHVVHFLDNLPLDACEDGAIARVSELAAKHDIEVEIGTRGTDPEHLLRYLKIAEKMDARLIRTMGGWHGAPASLEEVSDNLSKVLPSFSDAGVRIALENYEAYRTSDVAALVARLDHASLGICLDLTNSFGALESADEILGNTKSLRPHRRSSQFTSQAARYFAHRANFAALLARRQAGASSRAVCGMA